jgi:hypothetical protein
MLMQISQLLKTSFCNIYAKLQRKLFKNKEIIYNLLNHVSDRRRTSKKALHFGIQPFTSNNKYITQYYFRR